MSFKSLEISEWQQFQKVEIDFHDRITILTGANGSGKTTILAHILAIHSGWNLTSLATPKRNKKTGLVSFATRLFGRQDKTNNTIIGHIVYNNGQKTELQLSGQNSAHYRVYITGQQAVQCFFIPSHRDIFRYQAIDNISFNKKDKQTAFNEVSDATRERYTSGRGKQSTSFSMKSTLMSWAIQGYGVYNQHKEIIASDDDQKRYFEGFKEVLKKILPQTLGFEDFQIREREIVFVCNQGEDEFIFEQASGGICALIDIAWQIYMFSTKEKPDITVIIDEVENHLHPTMQRRILPDLLNAFPKARFIVSTHSPLVVGSAQDSNVYVLKYNDNGKIVSEKLDLLNQAKTATELLSEVLGVPITMPIWAEEKLKKIVDEYTPKEMTKDEFAKMRNELQEIGLEKLMPEAIGAIIDNKNG